MCAHHQPNETKQGFKYIQTFFEHVLYIFGSKFDKKKLVSCAEETSEEKKIFLSSPNDLKLSNYFIDIFRKVCGYF